MLLKLSILLPLLTHAASSGTCLVGMMDSCRQGHQRLADSTHQKAAQIAERMRAATADIASLTRENADLQAKAALLAAEQSLLEGELRFLSATPESPSAPPLPGFPGLENFFSLSAAARRWSNHYPEERGQRLSDRLNKNHSESGGAALRAEDNSRNIAALKARQQADQAQYNALEGEAFQHDRMWQEECKRTYCPDGQ